MINDIDLQVSYPEYIPETYSIICQKEPKDNDRGTAGQAASWWKRFFVNVWRTVSLHQRAASQVKATHENGFTQKASYDMPCCETTER
ncbi:MAG: hypothetical protein PHE50_07880 [Dehalococcoidales bacterium]|nr:hypothetical protein [Dehalococcoidales bacterium]